MKLLRDLCFFSLLVSLAHAQNITGTITGVVDDPAGAKIVGAAVTALNRDTGVSYRTTTTEAGVYVLPLLPLGGYEVSIENRGFKTFVRSNLALHADERLRVDARLELGAITDKVTVTAEAPLVQAEQATIGGSFVPSQFQRMPVGRDPLNMLQLIPGVLPVSGGYATANVNGSREETTDFKVDGTAAMTTAGSRAGVQPILEMVEEVVLQTATYSAEFARGSSELSVNTRAGTNEYHGALFHYFGNDLLNANAFMSNLFNTAKPILRYNLFGGTMGGPVRLPKLYDGHNRTFFTFGYEGTRQHGFGQAVSSVPTAAMVAGDFSAVGSIFDPATTRANPAGSGFVRTPFAGNQIPATRFDPVVQKVLPIGYPLPNRSGVANNYVNNNPIISNVDSFNARVDHNFNEKNRLTGRYIGQRIFNQSMTHYPGPAGAGDTNIHLYENTQNQVVSAEYSYLIRPSVVNTLRFGYFYQRTNWTGPGTAEDWAGKIGLKNAGPQTFPFFNIASLSALGGAAYALRTPSNNFQVSDTLLLVRGRHTLKFGYEYRNISDLTYRPNSTSGNFTFNTQPTMDPSTSRQGVGFASFLLGIPTTSTIALYPPSGFKGVWSYDGAFAQDDVRVNKKLTVNLGLRWDLNNPEREAHNQQSTFNLATKQLDFAGRNGVPSTLYDPNYKNFSPRAGLAWSPLGGSKLVVRAGYGIFFLPSNNLNYQRLTVGPWNQLYNFPSPDNGITFPLTLASGFPTVDPNAPYTIGTSSSLTFTPRHYPDGYTQQWSLNVQRELPGRTLVEVGYVGMHSTHLQGPLQLNQVPASLLGPGNAQSRRPYPTVGTVVAWAVPWGNANYHALQTRMDRRFSRGFSMQATYTFSKSIGDSAQNNGAFLSFGATNVQDNYNLRAEKSVQAYDTPHSFAYAFAWEVPAGKGRRLLNRGGLVNALLGGWNLSTISSLRSGHPLIMGTLQNQTGSLDGGSRPNRLSSGLLSGNARNIYHWFDTSAFALPAAFTFGNDSRTEPGLREPGVFSFDALLAKEFRFLEKRRVEFRAEAVNLLNHFNPGGPNTGIGNPAVGTITNGNSGRTMRLVLKLYY